MNPKYPIYIISKGRWESRLTSKTLEKMRVPYHIVIEPQELAQYSAVIDPDKILTLPFSNLGQGGIPARNWVWEHSISIGATRHWIMDDNIKGFCRNKLFKYADGTCFKVGEDFCDRYENIALAGPDYTFMGQKQPTRRNVKPFIMNTRVYSCILIQNDIPYRWRGRYNEDTDLSLRALKDGYCTILFYFCSQDKTATMTMKGGNTDELYKQDKDFDGRLEMAKHLQRQHPDVTKITRKWGRWQHSVDYRPFKGNRLIKKEGIVIPKGINNYGMVLVKK
mgnify:CR=1 FL=1